jgi:hypothetical protein
MVKGIVTGGIPGAAHWLIHIDRGHSDPSHYITHWGSIFARMLAMAAITFFLWLANRRVIKEFVVEMRGIWTSGR